MNRNRYFLVNELLHKKILKRILIASITISFLSSSFTALELIDPNEKIFTKMNPAIVQIPYIEKSIIGKLINYDIAILEIKKDSILLYASSEEIKILEKENLNPKIIFNSYSDMIESTKDPLVVDVFHNYAQLTAELQNIQNTYPEIAKLYNLGTSVQGRTIWGLKITDNPEVEEDEAEVRICGLHHGNELMSGELPLMLAWYLVNNYYTNSYIEYLVNNREIWIIPMVNTDGREANTRRNANNVDLNRDYGYMWSGAGDSTSPFSQPETKVMRENALDNCFVLSLSFHTSGNIVNYIWNYKGQPVKDHDVVVYLSNQYGFHNGYWVTEGYDWYQITGDTNDFSYGCRGDIDWTIEVQNSNIQQAWDLNRVAMLQIIEAADMGLKGIITDINTGLPIAATIWVEEAYWPCFTDPKVGDYHKPLLPGAYNVHIRANGYEEQYQQVTVTSSGPSVLNAALTPSNNYYAYQVTMCKVYDPYSPPNNYQNNPTEAVSALGPPDGICASLGKGGYIVLDMGNEILDHQDSNDFIIYEGDGSDDGYHVYVSSGWNGPWTYMGAGMGTTEFDLNDVGLASVQFIKIVDDNDGSAYEQNPGCDIDAVQQIIPIIPNNPPVKPVISGPIKGKPDVEYEYIFTTTDPDGDDIWYYITWGDGDIEEWIGPYSSGEEVVISHSWTKKGNFVIRARAKDDTGDESDNGRLDIAIPRNRLIFNEFLNKFLDRFTRAFPILRFILKM
jgi:hypothetical protein